MTEETRKRINSENIIIELYKDERNATYGNLHLIKSLKDSKKDIMKETGRVRFIINFILTLVFFTTIIGTAMYSKIYDMSGGPVCIFIVMFGMTMYGVNYLVSHIIRYVDATISDIIEDAEIDYEE